MQPNGAAIHPDFTPLTAADGVIETILELPDGSLLVGGSFSALSDGLNTSGTRLALVSPAGAILSDSTLNADSTVHKLNLQADGKILVAGNFSNINGVARPRAARLASDLSVDTGFTPPTTGTFGAARDIAEDPNGKILVVGDFFNWNNLNDTAYMIRFDEDGTHDTTFKSSASSFVRSVIPQQDGKYYIAGYFTDYGSNASADGLARINNDGTLDTSFLANPGFFFAEEVFQTGTGDLILLNEFQNPIRKYNSSATLETTFWTNFNANGGSRSIDEDSNGKYLIGGLFTEVAGKSAPRLVRVNPDGSTDISFDVGTGFNSDVKAITVASDGSIWVGGSFSQYNGNSTPQLIRLKGTPALSLFQQWINTNGLTGNHATFNADLDDDGIPNGIEFLFDSDPMTIQDSTLWNPLVYTSDGATINGSQPGAGLDPNKTYRQIQVRTPTDKKGLTPVLETSLNLNGFDTTNVHALGAPQINGSYELQTYYLTPAIEDAPNIFWRLNVSQ